MTPDQVQKMIDKALRTDEEHNRKMFASLMHRIEELERFIHHLQRAAS